MTATSTNERQAAVERCEQLNSDFRKKLAFAEDSFAHALTRHGLGAGISPAELAAIGAQTVAIRVSIAENDRARIRLSALCPAPAPRPKAAQTIANAQSQAMGDPRPRYGVVRGPDSPAVPLCHVPYRPSMGTNVGTVLYPALADCSDEAQRAKIGAKTSATSTTPENNK